jgi:hypothetical protein
MKLPLIIAVTWIGKEYRFFGLDWSYLVALVLEHRRQRRHAFTSFLKRTRLASWPIFPTR